VSRSTPEIELIVFIAARPRAPPFRAALPASGMLVTFGVSLAQKGNCVAEETQELTSSRRPQSWSRGRERGKRRGGERKKRGKRRS